MRRVTLYVCVAVMITSPCAVSASAFETFQDKDLAAVMRVVQRSQEVASPEKTRPREAQNIRVRIEDRESGEALRFAVPLSLIEWLASIEVETTLADLDDFNTDLEISLKEVLATLRDLGPSELIEIDGDEGKIRIWLD